MSTVLILAERMLILPSAALRCLAGIACAFLLCTHCCEGFLIHNVVYETTNNIIIMQVSLYKRHLSTCCGVVAFFSREIHFIDIHCWCRSIGNGTMPIYSPFIVQDNNVLCSTRCPPRGRNLNARNGN